MALKVLEVKAPTSEPYRYQERSDFTGGLNVRADQFNLEENESPDLLNVDVDPRGGVSRRNGIRALNSTALGDDILSVFAHSDTSNNQLLAAVTSSGNSKLYWNTSPGATTNNFESAAVASAAATVVFTGLQPPRAITFGSDTAVTTTYVVNGSLLDSEGTKSAVAWTGSNNATTLTPDIDASNGHFPCARYAAVWGERAWVGYTVESGTTYANRIRFSKSNVATNWTSTDFIDVDIGEDGDHITGLLADTDRLLVFKQNAIYAVYGFDRDTFQVVNVTRSVGNRDGSDPVWWTNGVFFWYAEDGVYLLNRDSIAWAFERLKPKIDDASLTFGTAPSIMWFDEKLWVSVDYQSGESQSGAAQTNRRNLFMWDSTLGQAGAWTRYDVHARSLLSYRPSGATHYGYAVTSEWSGAAAFTRVTKVDQDTDTDVYDPSGSAEEIQSHYQTGWFSGNRPTFPKRWGKTRTVMLADNTMTVVMDIYKDYDLASSIVSQSHSISGDASTASWDSAPSGDGNGVWDTSTWAAAAGTNIYKFFRWPTAGTAKAISLRFSVTPSPSARGKWGLTSVVGMYRTRRIR